jgi:hypothetical protein
LHKFQFIANFIFFLLVCSGSWFSSEYVDFQKYCQHQNLAGHQETTPSSDDEGNHKHAATTLAPKPSCKTSFPQRGRKMTLLSWREPISKEYPEPISKEYPEPISKEYPEPISKEYPEPISKENDSTSKEEKSISQENKPISQGICGMTRRQSLWKTFQGLPERPMRESGFLVPPPPPEQVPKMQLTRQRGNRSAKGGEAVTPTTLRRPTILHAER